MTRCKRCNKRLTVWESIVHRMGPVCRAKTAIPPHHMKHMLWLMRQKGFVV